MRRGVPAVITAAVALSLAACGDDDGDEAGEAAAEPTPVAMSVTESGKKATLDVPAEVKPGVARLTLRNDGKNTHEAQIVRVVGDHTPDEVLKAIQAEEGAPIPSWIEDGGGVGITKPGQTGEVFQDLAAGKYVVFDTEGVEQGQKPATAEFTVAGEASGAKLPPAEATITAKDYTFETDGLKAGANTVTFQNTGKELHHAIMVPYKPGATTKQVQDGFKSEEGEPPLDFDNGVATPVIDGGIKQVLDVPLKKGKYAFVCFIADRKGGPPHVAKGMLTEVEIG